MSLYTSYIYIQTHAKIERGIYPYVTLLCLETNTKNGLEALARRRGQRRAPGWQGTGLGRAGGGGGGGGAAAVKTLWGS